MSFSGAFTIPNDVLMMMPGGPGLAVTRFTAPEKGVFEITGSFADLQSATVSLAVVVNGITVFTGGFFGQHGTIPFSISNVYLDAGMTVDFIVDSLGSRDSDILGLKALITETNAAPTPALSSQVTSTLENGAALKVANVAVTDDGVGTNLLSLIGADAGSFSIQNGNELWFNGGANFEAKTSYAVTVTVDDRGGRDAGRFAELFARHHQRRGSDHCWRQWRPDTERNYRGRYDHRRQW